MFVYCRCLVLERLLRRCWLLWVLSAVLNLASRWRYFPCFFQKPLGIISFTYLWVWAPLILRGVQCYYMLQCQTYLSNISKLHGELFCWIQNKITILMFHGRSGLLFQGLRKKKHEHWEVICSTFFFNLFFFITVFSTCIRSKHFCKLEINILFPPTLI